MKQYSLKRCMSAIRFWDEQLRNYGKTVTVTVTTKESTPKEKVPPHPLKENTPLKKKEEEGILCACACAREIDPAERQKLIEEVAAYNYRLKGNISAEYFVDYYLSSDEGWPTAWKSRLRNWLKGAIKNGRISAKEAARQAGIIEKPKLDWCLCEERCAMFAEGRCTCGIAIPPASHPTMPMPPEQCGKFKRMEN